MAMIYPPPAAAAAASDVGSHFCAIEAAELRLAAAEKWASASALMLANARAQEELSRRELEEARVYLAGLKRKREAVRIGARGQEDAKVHVKDNNDEETIKPIGSSGSGETESETVFSGDDAPSGVATIRKVAEGCELQPSKADDGRRGEGDARVAACTTNKDQNGGQELRGSVSSPKGKATIVSPPAGRLAGKAVSIGDHSLRSTHSICAAVEVKDCGIPEINGRYHRFESSDGVPAYSKIAKYEGKEAIFTIGRWKSDTGTKKWCITATVPRGSLPPKQCAFYVATTTSFVLTPPKKNWMIVEGGEAFLPPEYEGRGMRPVPVIEHESDERSGKILGMQVANTKGARPGRRGVRSASTPKLSRSSRSVSSGRFRRQV